MSTWLAFQLHCGFVVQCIELYCSWRINLPFINRIGIRDLALQIFPLFTIVKMSRVLPDPIISANCVNKINEERNKKH